MATDTKQIVEKAWGFAHILRQEGLSYLAYIEQITFLLFLKMAHEVAIASPDRAPLVPEGWGWDSLIDKTGHELKEHYDALLDRLSQEPGMLGTIFRKPRPEIENPRTLRRLITDLIGTETWTAMNADVSGDMYEGLLDRTASKSPRGAGQYFTPRGLVSAIVDCMQLTPSDTVCDPAAGTGGFLLAAYRFAMDNARHCSTSVQRDHLAHGFVHGWELVPNTARLCVMNLYLHGVDTNSSPIHVGDALVTPADRKFSVVLTNPPFGTKGSLANGIDDEDKGDSMRGRPDFWAMTSNKQLNFLQHVCTLLTEGGRCAIVVPDNVLFEGGAGEIVRRKLLENCYVHTLLRLPPGIFYAQGVKANVLFFNNELTNRDAGLWVYDLRTNKRFTLRQRPIQRSDFDDFIECYSPGLLDKRKSTWSEKNPEGRWRHFDWDSVLSREKVNLDISWLKSEEAKSTASRLLSPQDIAVQITANLQEALEQFKKVNDRLK